MKNDSNITFDNKKYHVNVILGKKVVGKIMKDRDGEKGYRYYPNKQKTGGELFKTVSACKKSLF